MSNLTAHSSDTQSEQESHELKNKSVEELSSSLIYADQSSFSSSEAIPSRTKIPVVSQSFRESIETVKNIGEEIFPLKESLKWCSSIKSNTPLKAFSTPEKSKVATSPVETFSAGYKSVLEDTNPFHTDNTSQKNFSPIVGPSTSNDSPYYTPNNSKLNKPTTSTRGNQESRKLFNPKMQEEPRIDSASLGALRDAIKLIPEFNGDRESLDRYVVGLQEASEIINPELDKLLLKLSKTKLSSSVWNKVSKITFDSVKEYTEYLTKIYDPPRDVYQLTGELGSIYQRCSDSVDDFADRVRGLSEKILEAYRHKNGSDLPEQEKRRVEEMALSCFVRGLKLEIKQGMKSEETLSAATHGAREIERGISDLERLRGGDTTKPQTTKTDQRTNMRLVEALQSSATDPQKEVKLVVCQLCSKKGHIASVCHSKPSEPVLPTCQLCNKVGHTANKCSPLAVAAQGERSKAFQRCGRTSHEAENCLSSNKDADGQGLRICQLCGKRGHLADKCFSIPCRHCAISGHLSDSYFRKPQLKAQSNNALPVNNSNGNVAKPQCYLCQGVGHIAKNCGNHFSNQSNSKTFGPTLPRHQNQGGQNSRYPPPNVTYAQATGGSAPLRSCRYCKV